MNMTQWSQSRRTWWKRGWIALVTGVLLCPIGAEQSCADLAVSVNGESQCHTAYVPLLGMVTPLRYQATLE